MDCGSNSQSESDAAMALRLPLVFGGNSTEQDRWTESEGTSTHVDSDLPQIISFPVLNELAFLSVPNEGNAVAYSGRKSSLEWDEVLAVALQASFVQEICTESRNEQETALFASSPTGRAWNFVASVIRLHQRLLEKASKVSSVGNGWMAPAMTRDDLVIFIERLLHTQVEFRDSGKPYRTDVGYHYTNEKNMSRIKIEGLLSKPERDSRGIVVTHNGSRYGHGIYTANDATSFRGGAFGDVGLLVLRLHGKSGVFPETKNDPSVDTFLEARKMRAKILVLRKSCQCVPVLRFDGTKLGFPKAKELLREAHDGVQRIADDFFNNDMDFCIPQPHRERRGACPAKLAPIFGTVQDHRSCSKEATPVKLGSISYKVQDPLKVDGFTHAGVCTVVTRSVYVKCQACLAPFERDFGTVVRLEHCWHTMHLVCLKDALTRRIQCPICHHESARTVTPLGAMPSGTMTCTRRPNMICSGHSKGTLEIQYSFPAGIQASFHPNPGRSYESTTRKAYLPDNPEGRRLLSRLQEAFRCGLCFTIGNPMTSKRNGVITWASIPHKSRVSGGPEKYGFPDQNFFTSCNLALDALHVKA